MLVQHGVLDPPTALRLRGARYIVDAAQRCRAGATHRATIFVGIAEREGDGEVDRTGGTLATRRPSEVDLGIGMTRRFGDRAGLLALYVLASGEQTAGIIVTLRLHERDIGFQH